jgi:hypothetical protein
MDGCRQEKQIYTPMTQPIHLIGEIFAVEMPEGSDRHQIIHISAGVNALQYYLPQQEKGIGLGLPTGNWQIICTTKKCTSEQAKEITGEEAYPSIRLHSLITSKGLDPNKTLIIKKVS